MHLKKGHAQVGTRTSRDTSIYSDKFYLIANFADVFVFSIFCKNTTLEKYESAKNIFDLETHFQNHSFSVQMFDNHSS